ncbi:hypothetical protein KI387_007768, partial [Taxus chinensis]
VVDRSSADHTKVFHTRFGAEIQRNRLNRLSVSQTTQVQQGCMGHTFLKMPNSKGNQKSWNFLAHTVCGIVRTKVRMGCAKVKRLQKELDIAENVEVNGPRGPVNGRCIRTRNLKS